MPYDDANYVPEPPRDQDRDLFIRIIENVERLPFWARYDQNSGHHCAAGHATRAKILERFPEGSQLATRMDLPHIFGGSAAINEILETHDGELRFFLQKVTKKDWLRAARYALADYDRRKARVPA